MIQQPNKLEMGIIKLIIARIKSKSPAVYTKIMWLCGILASIMGAYVVAYTQTTLIPHAGYWATTENVFAALFAAFTAAGLVSATTTTDPALIHPEVKQNILDQAVQEGTHVPVDNGNDTNG